MVIDTDHLVNQIHAEVEGVAETGFPMDVFPERIQKIIYVPQASDMPISQALQTRSGIL